MEGEADPGCTASGRPGRGERVWSGELRVEN